MLPSLLKRIYQQVNAARQALEGLLGEFAE